MNALRRVLLRQRVARQLLRGPLCHAAVPGTGVERHNGRSGCGSVALCSGRGPLIVDVAALATRFDAGSPITRANDALAHDLLSTFIA